MQIAMERTRCDLCGRRVETRCKWCHKGGLGDPPTPEMASWRVWRKGLERVLRQALKRVGVDAEDEQRTVDAVFWDRGEVPETTRSIAFPYMKRLCSEGRYNAGRSTALLARRVYVALRSVYIAADEESFIERIERLRQLTREELLAQAKRDEAEKHQIQALSWHLEDVATIAVMVARRLRRDGVTPEQRSLCEIVQMTIDCIGVDASRRISPTQWDRIAAGIATTEIGKRRARIRVEAPPRVRIAIDMDLDLEAEREALASEEAVSVRVEAP